MGAAEATRAALDRAMARTERAVRDGLEAVGGRLIILSPVGDPALWQNPGAAPADYRGGQFRSNWNYGRDGVDRSTTTSTGITDINGLEGAAELIGHVHYISNSLPYAQALEYGHSSQAPVGIMAVIGVEAEGIAEQAAREAAQ